MTLRLFVSVAAFLGSIVLANYLTAHFGFVSMGFGQTATAGTFAAGLTLAFRDVLQDTLKNRSALIGLIILGALLSLAVAPPALALASGVAFVLSELADYAVYTPLRSRSIAGDRRWAGAVFASNVVGAIVDSIIFLAIAFGLASISGGIAGQLLGKIYVTILFILVAKVVLVTWRNR